MLLKKNSIHLLLLLGCLTGYTWLYLHFTNPSFQTGMTGVCLWKRATGIPCPSCGSTRAVLAILRGDLLQALQWNPFGFFLILFLIILPVWILMDLIRKDDSMLRCFLKAEQFFRQKKIAIPAIALILLNWYWNIHKGL